jgi:hypothetical protein
MRVMGVRCTLQADSTDDTLFFDPQSPPHGVDVAPQADMKLVAVSPEALRAMSEVRVLQSAW